MAVRSNPVRAKLRRGGTCFGTMAFEFFTPGLASALKACGAEFVILDMEHSGAGIDTMKQQLAYARGVGLVPMVRVPGSHYHLVATIMDAGAMGIMVPMVETREQAEKIASWCRYRPQGVRGLAFGMAHDDYTGGDYVAKMRGENARTIVIALVETATGIENVDAILSVPGVDIGWLGHFDLSNSLGIDGQFDHPRFKAALDRFFRACRRHGKTAGALAGTPAQARDWLKRGVRCLCLGTDISLLQGGYTAMRESLGRR